MQVTIDAGESARTALARRSAVVRANRPVCSVCVTKRLCAIHVQANRVPRPAARPVRRVSVCATERDRSTGVPLCSPVCRNPLVCVYVCACDCVCVIVCVCVCVCV